MKKYQIVKISDDRMEKLGKYFTHFNIKERHNISFEQFVQLVQKGLWEQHVAG